MITLQEYLEKNEKRTADLARAIDVKHCVARRWVRGEAIPTKETMQKIYEWTAGEVEPNDFYNINPTEETDITSSQSGDVAEVNVEQKELNNANNIMEN